MDQKKDLTNLWRTIKGIDGSAKCEAVSHKVQPTVHHFKAGQTHFFKRDPISDKGNQDKTLGDGTNIHCRSRAVEIGHDKLSIFQST